MTHSSGYRADIQGLRAIAVLLVLMFHFETPVQGGFLGVDMFFVISGFVITASSLREIERTNHFSLSTFLGRRVRRLLPGMAVVTLGTALLSLLLMSPFGPQQETAKMLLSAATYTSNFVLMTQNYFSLDPKGNPLLHLWSLAVEEQIYLVWPFAVVLFLRLRRRISPCLSKFIAWLILLGTTTASLWLFMTFSINGQQINDSWWFTRLNQWGVTAERFAFYSPFTRAWEFAAGVFVALFLKKKTTQSAPRSGAVLTCSGVLMVLSGVVYGSIKPEIQHGMNWSTNTTSTLMVVIGTASWIVGGSFSSVAKRLISSRPFIMIGDWSYSIYLLHWPIWVLLITSFEQTNTLVFGAFVASLMLGWLQFRFTEEPIRSGRKYVRTTTIQFVGTFILVASISFGSMMFITPQLGLHLAGVKPNELSLHVIEMPCAGERYKLGSAQSCLFEAQKSEGNAVLVGDSMAKSLSSGFANAANEEGLNVYVFSRPGCAFNTPHSPFSVSDECVTWRRDVFSALVNLQPRVVAIANLNSLYAERDLPGYSSKEAQNIWGGELTRTLTMLSSLQTELIVVQPPPLFDYDLRYDISFLWPNSVIESRGVVVSRREQMNQIEENAAARLHFVQPVVNFTELFCDTVQCDPKKGNAFLFEDADHLSVQGSLLVTPLLQSAIAAALSK